MGLLDIFGGGDEIQAPQITVSPETEKRITDFTNNATRDRSPGEMKASIPASSSREKSLYGYEPQMGNAIRQRYQGVLGQDMKRLNTMGKVEDIQDQSRRLQQASGIAQARQQINMINYQRQMEARRMNEQARSSTMASVLGLVGTVGGFMIGGPMGAAAGSQLGSMAGGGGGGGGSPSYLGGSQMASQLGNRG